MTTSFGFGGNGYTLRHLLDKGSKLWSDKVNQSLLTASGVVLETALRLRKGDITPLEVGSSAVKVAGQVFSLYDMTHHRHTQTSRLARRFEEIKEQGQVVLSVSVANLITAHLELSRIKTIDSEVGSTVKGIPDKPNSPMEQFLCAYDTPAGTVYWVTNGAHCSDIVCGPGTDAQACLEHFRDVVWGKFGGIIDLNWDSDNEDFEFIPKKEMEWGYEGEQGESLAQRWKMFREAGIRRHIILHGPPGTGKSTLARHIAKQLKSRTLFIPVQVLDKTINSLWFERIIRFLGSEYVIIDDLDRLTPGRLEFLLNFFEEGRILDTPLLVATTNHLSRLPDAIKRPGRFDEIWAINPPKGEIRTRVIQYLASLEGLELEEDQADKVAAIAESLNLPGAHIREILRRVKVMGWEEVQFSDEDMTFSSEWVVEDPFDSFAAAPVSSTEHDDEEEEEEEDSYDELEEFFEDDDDVDVDYYYYYDDDDVDDDDDDEYF